MIIDNISSRKIPLSIKALLSNDLTEIPTFTIGVMNSIKKEGTFNSDGQ
jgi:hypothetical protein